MQSDVNKIDLSLLSSIKDELKDEENKFNYQSYNAFKSGYINKCSDPNVLKLKSKLETMYKKISNGYENVYDWFNEYIKTASSLENSLANDSNSVQEPQLNSFVSSKLMNFSSSVTSSELFSDYNNKKTDFDSPISNTLNFGSFIKNTACTVVTTGVSLIEGVVKSGEYLWDILNYGIDGAVRSIMYFSGKLTKADVEWGEEELLKKIGQKNSKELFDLIWDSDSMKEIKENSYLFDINRQFSTESSKIIMIELLKILKIPEEITGATFGFMDGVEAAYANGADYDKANMEGVKQASLDTIATSNDTPDIFGDFHKTATKYVKF